MVVQRRRRRARVSIPSTKVEEKALQGFISSHVSIRILILIGIIMSCMLSCCRGGGRKRGREDEQNGDGGVGNDEMSGLFNSRDHDFSSDDDDDVHGEQVSVCAMISLFSCVMIIFIPVFIARIMRDVPELHFLGLKQKAHLFQSRHLRESLTCLMVSIPSSIPLSLSLPCSSHAIVDSGS